MSKIAHSFAEMAQYLNLAELSPGPAEQINDDPEPEPQVEPTGELAELLAQLQSAGATLATVIRRDQESKALALTELDRYEALLAQCAQAEAAAERAHRIAADAETIAANAFADEARDAALQVARVAAEAESQAAQLLQATREEADQLAEHLDLDRLRVERQRQNERAAEVERTRRLSDALRRARAALDAGRFEEAKAVLGPAGNENPDNADVASLLDSIAQGELTVKAEQTEDVLHQALFEFRQDAASALARLEALDVDGLPEPLARQVFGGWARVCAWRCRELGLEPLRFAPFPGRGAVIARESSEAPYTVFSALGMGLRWSNGSPVSDSAVERSRPLP
jgi:hypothetical protein